MAVSKSFLCPLEKIPWLQIWDNLELLFYGTLCVLIKIASYYVFPRNRDMHSDAISSIIIWTL